VLNFAPIGPKDSLVCWNFREDRMREIVRALAVSDFDGFVRPRPPFESKRVLCFTDYDHTFHLPFLFSALEIKNHLGEYLSNLGRHQLRVAETEKYAHVTYFFDGGHETPCAGEERALIPSPRDVRTYDLKPEMSALPVMDAVIKGINDDKFDLIVVNFANCDMVGHTGNIPAAIKAVETVDACLGQIIAVLQRKNGQAIIIADHGNADQMIHYEDGSPHTAHTTHPVPMIAFGNSSVTKLADGGALCDVAPTLLKMMGLAQPKEMTGRSLA
jgi:2,3-bisphosphoglycerate-independent phosphoglycerate mutase